MSNRQLNARTIKQGKDESPQHYLKRRFRRFLFHSKLAYEYPTDMIIRVIEEILIEEKQKRNLKANLNKNKYLYYHQIVKLKKKQLKLENFLDSSINSVENLINSQDPEDLQTAIEEINNIQDLLSAIKAIA